MRCLGPVSRVESLALHFEIRLDVNFGGFHVDMSKEIFDHDERNTGLEKVHGLCVSHGMRADPHARQSRHGACGPSQILQQNVSGAVPAQSAPLPVLQEWLLFVELTPLGAQELADELSGLRQQWA